MRLVERMGHSRLLRRAGKQSHMARLPCYKKSLPKDKDRKGERTDHQIPFMPIAQDRDKF